ncbi:MAG: ferrous iron transporter B [Clostridia bacterium]|nr:ferrous iron transporter B [Clostridia bacterium]
MEIRIALAGNPNSGKTTLFNALTGANQFVGNWPGVTVEKKEGKLKKHDGVIITDLPGIYSLSPYTLEEVVARNYLIEQKPDAILNIVDGTNLERNLYLTTQLTELGIPVVVAINMMDVVNKKGDEINIDELSKKLGCKVVQISALKNKGVIEAAEEAIKVAKSGKANPAHKFDQKLEKALSEIGSLILKDVPEDKNRWYSVKLFERDSKVMESCELGKETFDKVEEIIAETENEFDDDSESIITNERYVYISSIIKSCHKKKSAGKMTTSDKIDRIVTNRWLALPIFAVIMFCVYFIAVTTVGTWVTDWTNDGLFGDGFHFLGISGEYDEKVDEFAEPIWNDANGAIIDAAEKADVPGAGDVKEAFEEKDYGAFEEAYASYGAAFEQAGFIMGVVTEDGIYDIATYMEENAPDPSEYGAWVPGIPALIDKLMLDENGEPYVDWFYSLVQDGIIAGVGAILGFVPQILVLFILLAFLESCGYMARIAFVMDRIFRRFGLSGKSFIPMLIGVGCGVPGIMASRTIENEKDRRMTIMTTTFIPCGAKLPIIALIAGALFDGAWWVAPSAYFIGIAAIIVSGIILKKTKRFAGDPAPFIMELPAYHMPTVKNILHSMWERGWSFIKKAGTIIFVSTIFIWLGTVCGVGADGSYVFDLALEENGGISMLSLLGMLIGWIFAPLGFSAPQTAVATIMGLVAKEEVVAVLGVTDFMDMTQLAAYSFLIFNLLCAPCFAAIGAIKREMNSTKWTLFAIAYQCGFAYAISFIVYQIGSLFTSAVATNVFGVVLAFIVLAAFVYMLFKPAKFSLIELAKSKRSVKK